MAVALSLLTACPNKTPVTQTLPPPPAPPTPTATIDIAPSSVQAGQPVTITWKTTNATDVSIESIGAVNPNGSQTLVPTESTTYRLTAKGPGGTEESTAHVTVVAPGESSASNEEPLPSDSSTRLDVFFDSDDFAIRPDQTETIKNDAGFLKEHADLYIMIEGHCDEMGSAEYNLALGDRRAEEVKLALEKAGINSARVGTISYGKERPGCVEPTDACWKLNRRAHIVPDPQH